MGKNIDEHKLLEKLREDENKSLKRLIGNGLANQEERDQLIGEIAYISHLIIWLKAEVGDDTDEVLSVVDKDFDDMYVNKFEVVEVSDE